MKTAKQLTIALLIAIVFIVLIGSIMLLNDPSGRILQLSSDDIKGSLMKDFAPFAWLLIATAGIIGLITAILIFIHQKYSSILIITEGIILLIWCVVFITYVSNSILIILIFGFVGAALILLGRLINKQQKDITDHHVVFNESRHHSSHKKSHYHKHRKRGH